MWCKGNIVGEGIYFSSLEGIIPKYILKQLTVYCSLKQCIIANYFRNVAFSSCTIYKFTHCFCNTIEGNVVIVSTTCAVLVKSLLEGSMMKLSFVSVVELDLG